MTRPDGAYNGVKYLAMTNKLNYEKLDGGRNGRPRKHPKEELVGATSLPFSFLRKNIGRLNFSAYRCRRFINIQNCLVSRHRLD